MIAKTKYTSQYIDNLSFDDELKVSMVEIIGSDGSTVGEKANRIAIVGNYIYEGNALPGSDTSQALWQISRFDKVNLVTLWADGNTSSDNIWDDYLSLTYL
jgi:hypothetical protein